MIKTLTVLVLRGGPGSEREVSLASGGAVASALERVGYHVLQQDITPENLSALDCEGVDLFFPMLHGTFGEDGRLQGILEERKLKFVGSGSAASRLAIDKYQSKQWFRKAGLNIPLDVFIPKSAAPSQIELLVQQALEKMGSGCVVKPNAEGSSVGIEICRERGALAQAVHHCLSEYGDCLVEQYIPGREFTVGIVGDQCLPVLEIRPGGGFYDYRAKYEAEDTQYLFDLDVPEAIEEQMRQWAWKAFECLGCRDLARVDFMLDEAGGLFVLELNTIPGFTSHSLVPKAAGQAGLSMEMLCDRIVQIACDRPIDK